MQDVTLKAKTRELHGKSLQKLRAEGQVPGVMYGQGKEAVSLQADGKDVNSTFMTAGTNRLVSIVVDDKKPVNTIFIDVQKNPITGNTLHFDLYTVKMNEKIETEVPIHFSGEAPAVYNLNGVLVRNLETIEIKALPADLPENFEVDLAQLEEIGQAIHVSDLKAPQGVEILNDPEELVVKADFQEEEEIEAELPPEGTEADLVESEHGGDKAEEAEGEAPKE